MDLNLSDEDKNFRKEVKDFIKKNLSSEQQKKIKNGGSYTKDETIKWQRALFKNNWFAVLKIDFF